MKTGDSKIQEKQKYVEEAQTYSYTTNNEVLCDGDTGYYIDSHISPDVFPGKKKV